MLTCHEIAEYFLARARIDEESGEAISNLKLQKLVYYAQGVFLALNDDPLFGEPIEAWTHGPVVAELYHRFKEHGSDAIPFNDEIDLEKYDTKTREVLDEVYQFFGQFSGWKLRNMTHEEPPWANARKTGTISHASMREYFKTIVETD